MILNSGQHTQPDPQSCRVRSLGGAKGGSPKQTTHQETKTKLSSANANTEKASRQHCRSGISTSPTPCCESLRTTPKQFQTTWCFGKDWRHAGGARDLQSATVFPGILPFRYTCKVLLFGKAAPFFSQKRSLQQSHFRGRKHIGFWTPKSGPPQLR